MSDDVRFEEIMKAVDRLRDLSRDHVILVEGRKDREALECLGVEGDMFQIQSGGGPARAAEYVMGRGGKAVVLTDWDRKGGAIARDLRSLLGPENADVDYTVREDLSRLARHYVKDVEALDSLVARLRGTLNYKGSRRYRRVDERQLHRDRRDRRLRQDDPRRGSGTEARRRRRHL